MSCETPRLDLEAYFARIGIAPVGAPTLEGLAAIQLAHACSIAFENFDVLMGGGATALDAGSLFEKLVTRGRGGYCFEHGGLMLAVLGQLGYRVSPLSGRVRASTPRPGVPPRTHLFLRVEIGGVGYLFDTGVGGLTPTMPLRMDTEEAQQTPHDVRRVVREDDGDGVRYFHQILIDDEWRDVVEFTGEEMPIIDREVGHWWTSTNPASKFRRARMAAIAHRDGTRSTLLDDQLVHRRGVTGRAEVLSERTLEDVGAVSEVVRDVFRIRLPEGVGVPSAVAGQ